MGSKSFNCSPFFVPEQSALMFLMLRGKLNFGKVLITTTNTSQSVKVCCKSLFTHLLLDHVISVVLCLSVMDNQYQYLWVGLSVALVVMLEAYNKLTSQ